MGRKICCRGLSGWTGQWLQCVIDRGRTEVIHEAAPRARCDRDVLDRPIFDRRLS